MKEELEGLSKKIELERIALKLAEEVAEFQESTFKVVNKPRSRSKKNKLHIAEEYAQLKF